MPEGKFPLTITIIARNEAARIAKAIRSAQWVEEILVVDAQSTDETAKIAADLGAKVVVRSWPGFGQQKNFAQSESRNDWILNIDADEIISGELQREISDLFSHGPPMDFRAFQIPRKAYFRRRWIRFGGWYPDAQMRLYNRRFCRWTEPPLHETLCVDGNTRKLRGHLNHFSFDGILDQASRNLRYARLGAEDLKLNGMQLIIWALVKPWVKFVKCFLFQQGFRDGFYGFVIAVNAAYSQFLKYTIAYETRIDRRQ